MGFRPFPIAIASMSSQNSLDEKHSDLQLEAATDVTVMQPPARMFTDAEEKRLYRRLDLRVMPILALLYLLSYVSLPLEPLADFLQLP